VGGKVERGRRSNLNAELSGLEEVVLSLELRFNQKMLG
jgi:hypothetical protein